MSNSAAKQIPPFLVKLYEMANESTEHEDCFTWSDDGTSFWVSNIEAFSRDVLPSYFKHNNYASFVRQLNMYGFRRTTEPKGKVVPGVMMVELFRHPMFVRGRRDLLSMIQRKTATAAKKIKLESDTESSSPTPSSAPSVSYGSPQGPVVPEMQLQQQQLQQQTPRADLVEQNVFLQTQISWLQRQNDVLQQQQQRQTEAMQHLVRMLAALGVSDPRLTDMVAGLSAPVNMAALIPSSPAQLQPRVEPQRRDSFNYDLAALAAASSQTYYPLPGQDLVYNVDDDLMDMRSEVSPSNSSECVIFSS